MLVACGDNLPPAQPDAPPPADAMPDALVFAACREFGGSSVNLPVHMSGMLDASDVSSPQMCGSVDAPYGIASAGPDSVVSLDNLIVGTAYIVQLRSSADLAFYVVSGCSTMTGPAASECALFVDASAGGEEVGRFVANGTSAFVVVDYYASATPADRRFTLDVYAEACTDDSACTNVAMPVCHHGRCVECANSFDCATASEPVCDGISNTCTAGADMCTADDATEPMDDGPAGAIALAPDAGGAFSAGGQICSTPRTEVDVYKLDVAAAGETWDLSLSWSGGRDLDLEVYAADGETLGLSFWEQPEGIRLAYLPVGSYYLFVSDFSFTTTAPVSYTLSGQRVSSTGCTTRADCAVDFRNQLFRGNCTGGACVSITATGLAAGDPCDTEDDCQDSLACPDFFFVANADTRSVCAPHCMNDGDCAAVGGSDYVCTTYLASQNFCVQKCTSTDQCPTDPSSPPVTDPWYRLVCQTSSGKCVLP
jgi:hypothetical protein